MVSDRWKAGLIGLAVFCVFLNGCRQGTETPEKTQVAESAGGEDTRGSSPIAASDAKKRLNVLLITLDTTRADALGVYGQPLPVTPNIDRLAREGVLFRDAVSAAPLTLPSHTSIMTARYPFVHGVRSNDGYILPQESVTLAEILRDHGYRTAAEISAMVLNRVTGINQGFDSYRDLTSSDIDKVDTDANPLGRHDVRRISERFASDITKHGIAFLASSREAPFFLWLHYFSPHDPYAPPQPMLAQTSGDAYLGEVRYVDHEVGVVLNSLEKLGLTENTLIVVVADHGESLGEHGEPTHAMLVYDTTMHVPLLFNGPVDIMNGLEVNGVVRTVDIAPTILELLGLPPMDSVQGVSLVPLLNGQSTDLGLLAYGESSEAKKIFGSFILRFVRRGDWKYIHKLEPQLFDLRSDPSEHRNVAGDESERSAALRASLGELITNAPKAIKSQRLALSREEARQLAALGYVTAGMVAEVDDGLESLDVYGPDPDKSMGDGAVFSTALDAWGTKRFKEAFEILTVLAPRYPNSMPIVQLYLVTSLQLKRYDVVIEIVNAVLAKGDALDDFWPHFSEGLAKEMDLRDDAAATVLERLVNFEPCNIALRSKLAETYRLHGEYRKKITVLESGLAQCEPRFELMNDLSYLLSTCPVDSVRDGGRALELARRAVELRGHDDPVVLDTLAAAHAEIGDFAQATLTARKALAVLDTLDPSPERRAVLQAHLDLLERGEPIRED